MCRHAATMENMKKKNTQQPATKADLAVVAGGLTADIEALASSTAKEFTVVHRKIDTLNEKMDTGFTEMRQEMREGFKMVVGGWKP